MTEIYYKCTCMKAERSVYVQSRKKDQNVVTWLEVFVKPAIGADHSIISPRCQATAMEYAKFQVHPDTPLGAAKPNG